MPFSRTLSLAAAVAGAACVATLTVATPAFAAACPSGYQPRYVDSNIDFARIHRQPASADVIGQIPRNSRFCFNQISPNPVKGDYWYHGYGYNGSTKVTGWIAEDITHG